MMVRPVCETILVAVIIVCSHWCSHAQRIIDVNQTVDEHHETSVRYEVGSEPSTQVVTTEPSPFTEGQSTEHTVTYRSVEDQPELYTAHPVNHRQMKQSLMVFNNKCPKQHHIHPCDCLELDKQVDAALEDGSGASENADSTVAERNETNEESEMETVAFCKNIRNVQVLTEAIRGFRGHRINYFVLDGCKIPPFPNNLFQNIHIVWMEILNSTMQFHDNYFHNGC